MTSGAQEAQQERLPRARLVDHLLVELTHAPPIREASVASSGGDLPRRRPPAIDTPAAAEYRR